MNGLMSRRILAGLLSLLVALIGSVVNATAQIGAKNGEWRTYGGDLGSTRYAPLDQINAENFSKLQVAWRFKTDILGARPDFNLQTTPLMINGVLYATAGSRRDAVAIDADDEEIATASTAIFRGPEPTRTGARASSRSCPLPAGMIPEPVRMARVSFMPSAP